jgi:hypothetical protein
MKKHYRTENDCLNCGATLQGKFCHVCGQENLEMKETFGHMMNHAISDYFHFDYQFFHTLKPLILQPGKLTNEYMSGHRAAYLHPVKMYIFISVVYFLLLFQNASDERMKAIDQGKKPVNAAKILDSVSKEIAKDTTMNSLEKSIVLNSIKKNGNVTIGKNGDVNVAVGNPGTFTLFDDPATRNDTSYQQYLNQQKKIPESQRDGLFMREVHKKSISYKQKYGSRAKEVFWEEFKHNVPKMMFVMLPLFALILKIAFSKNHKLYVEHMIYSFHLHCFLFLFLAIIMLVQMVIPSTSWHLHSWMDFIATIFVMWYIYKSLRVVYHRSAGRTISKMIGISFSYYVAFVFCMVLVVFITALTMSA